MILRARQHQWEFPRPALIMGIVNVTPDSFSDGGRFLRPEAAVAHALELVRQGADILDVGGESTRPQATPVPAAEELQRVLPVVEELATRTHVPISIDTRKPEVARAALQAGACIVNDVAANGRTPEDPLWRCVAESQAGYVLMHMQGTPEDMQVEPSYQDVVREVGEFFEACLERGLPAAGIGRDQVMLDVGIGFGKTPAHNLQLLARLESFTRWERPLLLGASRKSFIQQVTGAGSGADRLGGSLACACWAVQQGGNILRTHDVRATRQAVQLTEAILARQRATAKD